MEVHERVRSPLLDTVLGWNLSAARRFNEYPGPVSVVGGQEQATDRRSAER